MFDANTEVGIRFVLTIIVCMPAVKSSTKGVNILLPTAGGKLSNAPPAESWMYAFSVSIKPSSLVSALGKSPGAFGWCMNSTRMPGVCVAPKPKVSLFDGLSYTTVGSEVNGASCAAAAAVVMAAPSSGWRVEATESGS